MPRRFASPLRILVAVLIVASATAAQVRADDQIAANIGTQEAYELASSGRIQIVDIRRPSEWRQTGIATGAIPLTMHQPFRAFLAEMKAVGNDNAGKTIAIICAAGVRTRRMQRILADNGLRVVNIAPGMLGTWLERGWIQDGLPVTRYGHR